MAMEEFTYLVLGKALHTFAFVALLVFLSLFGDRGA